MMALTRARSLTSRVCYKTAEQIVSGGRREDVRRHIVLSKPRGAARGSGLRAAPPARALARVRPNSCRAAGALNGDENGRRRGNQSSTTMRQLRSPFS